MDDLYTALEESTRCKTELFLLTNVLRGAAGAPVLLPRMEAVCEAEVDELDVGVRGHSVRQHDVFWLDGERNDHSCLKHHHRQQQQQQQCQSAGTLRSKCTMFLLCMKPSPFRICSMNSMASLSSRFSFSAMKSNSSPPVTLKTEQCLTVRCFSYWTKPGQDRDRAVRDTLWTSPPYSIQGKTTVEIVHIADFSEHRFFQLIPMSTDFF